MSIIERATAHYAAKSNNRVEVPEWSDDPDAPLVLVFDKMTMGHSIKVNEKHKGDILGSQVSLLIWLAKTEDGRPAFAEKDRIYLLNSVDPTVLYRVVREGTRIPTLEDVEGNSETSLN